MELDRGYFLHRGLIDGIESERFWYQRGTKDQIIPKESIQGELLKIVIKISTFSLYLSIVIESIIWTIRGCAYITSSTEARWGDPVKI